MHALASYREAFSVAVRSMLSSKLRSFLTLLGVILATTTLIVVMSLVHGMDVYVANQVSDMGPDGFQVQRIPLLGDFDPKKMIELDRRNPKLKAEEFRYLKSHVTLVREFGMEASRNVGVQLPGAECWTRWSWIGVSANIAVISYISVGVRPFHSGCRRPAPQRGGLHWRGHARRASSPTATPIGKTIKVDGVPFEVIGTATKRGSVFGFSRDNFVMIPIGTYFKIFGSHNELQFSGLALNRDRLNDAEDEVRVLLRSYRHLRPNQEDNFGLLASASLVELWDRLTKVLATMAVGIVSVFMVVGGVVIMNIMLAVVTERTYEIGIRKAVGARQAGYYAAVPDRIVAAFGQRRNGGRADRLARHPGAARRHQSAHGRAAFRGGHRGGADGAGRAVLRRVSGPARGAARPDPRAEVGTMTVFEFRSAAAMALATVREHKARSLLTVLGVIIGTGAVIAVGSIITGVNGAITDMATAFGPETIFSFQFNLGFRGNIQAEEWKRKKFTWDLGAGTGRPLPLRAVCFALSLQPQHVRPGRMDRHAPSTSNRDLYNVEIAGTEEGYAAGRRAEGAVGPLLHRRGKPPSPPVVVIGEHVYKSLFQGGDPIGKWIEVDGHQLQVVGVIGQRRRLSRPGGPARPACPTSPCTRSFPPPTQIMFVIWRAQGHGGERHGRGAVGAAVRCARRRPTSPTISGSPPAARCWTIFTASPPRWRIVMVALSSIGLLVGGIGVMNIMLVSVTERTREIGIRKAVGARRADIVVQFLTEAVVLTGLGGLLGMTLGWLISLVFRLVFPSLPTSVPLWAAALGVAVSVGVGLFFGTWPALKAARLDPVVALQYE